MSPEIPLNKICYWGIRGLQGIPLALLSSILLLASFQYVSAQAIDTSAYVAGMPKNELAQLVQVSRIVCSAQCVA